MYSNSSTWLHTHALHTHKPFHNSTQTIPSSPMVRASLVIFWLPPPALSFPGNQLHSVTGMEGEITLERHRVEISAKLRHYLATLFSKASSRQPLSDNKAPACPHRTARRIDRRTWKNYWWADKLFCYPNSLPSCFCPPALSFCLSAHLHFDVSIWLSYFHRLSPFSLPLPSLSPSVSHCISVSVTLPSFFHTCE